MTRSDGSMTTTSVYLCGHIDTYIHIVLYIYVSKEREREKSYLDREIKIDWIDSDRYTNRQIDIQIYIYIYIDIFALIVIYSFTNYKPGKKTTPPGSLSMKAMFETLDTVSTTSTFAKVTWHVCCGGAVGDPIGFRYVPWGKDGIPSGKQT